MPQLTISRKIFLFFTLLLIVVASLSACLWIIIDNAHKLTQTQIQQFESHKLGENPISPNVVHASVLAREPNADISFISWPGSPFATPHHYTVALRGSTPLTERLIKIALVDAATGSVTTIEETPWYISAINLSVPLHFGDYGKLPLKIIWALFDLAAIIVLITGLYLWLQRRNKPFKDPFASDVIVLGE